MKQHKIMVLSTGAALAEPLNGDALLPYLEYCKASIVVEDHNMISGLGSTVSECASSVCPRKVIRIGIEDRFPGSGTPNKLFKNMQLSEIFYATDANRNVLKYLEITKMLDAGIKFDTTADRFN